MNEVKSLCHAAVVEEGEDDDDDDAEEALIEASMPAKSPSSPAVGQRTPVVPPSPTLSTPSTTSSLPHRHTSVRLSSSLSSMLATANGLAQPEWSRSNRRTQTSATATATPTPPASLLAPPGRANRPSRRHSGVNNSGTVGGVSGNGSSGAGHAFSNKINQVRCRVAVPFISPHLQSGATTQTDKQFSGNEASGCIQTHPRAIFCST